MKRLERKLFHLNDRLARLAKDRLAIEAELSALRAIDHDAQRDAALGYDRLEATSTRNDVRRFERALAEVAARHERLRSRRQRLMGRLLSASE